jgi:hypothetical protein
LTQTEYEQNLLAALDITATSQSLQYAQSQTLLNEAIQMQSRVVVNVYVKSNENIAGKKVNIIANKIKAALASTGTVVPMTRSRQALC